MQPVLKLSHGRANAVLASLIPSCPVILSVTRQPHRRPCRAPLLLSFSSPADHLKAGLELFFVPHFPNDLVPTIYYLPTALYHYPQPVAIPGLPTDAIAVPRVSYLPLSTCSETVIHWQTTQFHCPFKTGITDKAAALPLHPPSSLPSPSFI